MVAPGRGGEPDRSPPPRVGLLLTLLARLFCCLLPLPPLAITFRFCGASSFCTEASQLASSLGFFYSIYRRQLASVIQGCLTQQK